ncbi:MAG: diguanylate cyclase [Campylobacterota bacterium]|nr:diguanylate cyclase [Campylobacterota bacterium]
METILIVDDTKSNINILIELLSDDYDILACRDGQTAIEMAQEDKPDLILLDIMMPEMDGFEVCEKLKEDPTTKEIPIIFITAMSDEDSIEKAYDFGGSDYVTKPFRPKELKARVKRELQVVSLQKELKNLASTDSMTKLYNRRYFSQVSSHIFDLAKRDSQRLSLIMMDIDKFKTINDTYGHAVGDEVIIQTAEILKQHQRKSDIICRFGGEEFVILLPETDTNGASIVAQKIRQVIESTSIKVDNNINLNYTMSLGVTQVFLNEDKDIEKALLRADEALYKAKDNGRNCVVSL